MRNPEVVGFCAVSTQQRTGFLWRVAWSPLSDNLDVG